MTMVGYHVVGDVSREDLLTIISGVNWDLDPLKMIGEEETSSSSETPASAVAHCLSRNLSIITLEELNRLNIGVIEVKRLIESDHADVVIKLRIVPATMIVHA